MNAVAAITRLPVRGDNPDARHLLGRKQLRSRVPPATPSIQLTSGRRSTSPSQRTGSTNRPMLQDILAGRLTEIDAINGAIVLQGRARGVSTPDNDALASLIVLDCTPRTDVAR
jgi:Ketopantoate reductase PanE/ApbA C terminal